MLNTYSVQIKTYQLCLDLDHYLLKKYQNSDNQLRMNPAPKESLKSKIKQKCVKLISNSTFHGFPKIVSNESVIRKMFWSLITIVMIAYLSLSITNSVIDYSSFSVITNINTVYEKQTTFPAMTICGGDIISCFFGNKRCLNKYLKYRNDVCPKEFNRGLNQSFYPIETLSSTIPGVSNGLRLTVLPRSDTKQFKIYIYNQSADFDLNQALFVNPNMQIYIVMSKVLNSKLSSPYSDCKKEYLFEPKPLDLLNKTSYPYFQSECFWSHCTMALVYVHWIF